MSVERVNQNLLFPKVTNQAIRSEVAGHSGVQVGIGAEIAALYALGADKPAWGVGLSIVGALHFFLAKMNFVEVRRIKGRSINKNL